MTTRPLSAGDVLHGYAGGVFGRDHYDCCRIEAAGPDWIVARNNDGAPSFASGTQSLQSLQRNRDKPCTTARHRQLDGDAQACCPLAQNPQALLTA